MVDERLMGLLMGAAVKYTNRINEVLLEADDLRELDDKRLAIAAIMYSAGLARMTKLNMEDFVALSMYAYQNVETGSKSSEQPEPEAQC